jgi:hypothetical protein
MITKQLPANYAPFETVEFCSNRLIRVKVPIAFDSTPIVLLGSGNLPRLWVSAPSNPSWETWSYIVEENRSLNPVVKVEQNEKEQMVLVKVSGVIVLQARQTGSSSLIVDLVDLAPIGLNVKGSSTGLSIGGMSLKGNTFQDVYVAFGMGSGK